MRLMSESSDRRYQCYYMEPEDLNDPAGLDMMVDARFLDFPHDIAISEGTRNSAKDIVSGLMEDPNQEPFILWDSAQQSVIGRSVITNLECQPRDMPELEGFYVLEQARGKGLANLFYDASLLYLQEAGFESAKVKVTKCNRASFKCALRNGFSLYSPEGLSGDDSYHLMRNVSNYAPNPDLGLAVSL